MEQLINTIFYYAETLKEYTDALEENKVLSRTIVFVDETGEIYKNGKVFGSYKKLAEMINQLAQETRNAMDQSAENLRQLMEQLRQGVWDSFLEELGITNENIQIYKTKLDQLRSEFDQKVIEEGNAAQQIDAINGVIREFTSWKSSVTGTLTTFQNIMDAQTASIVRQGERLDTLNNSVTNFQELIDLQNQTFRQYIENYDITNKVKNIIGREMLLNDGLLHDYATKTDVDQSFRNSIDVWFNSLEPSWQQLTSQAQNGQNAYVAMSGFRSEISGSLNTITAQLNSVEAATTQFANWHDNNKDFIASLRTAAGDNAAYFDLTARLEDDDVVAGLASRVFGYVNSSGDSSLVLQADHVQIDGSQLTITPQQVTGLGDWFINNVTVNKLKAIGSDSKWLNIDGTTGITNSEDGFKFNMNGSGHVAKGKLSWDTSGNVTFGDNAGKILTNGSGYFALNKFRWDTAGNIQLGGSDPVGIALNANGSGHVANGLISWDAQGNININTTPGKTIIIGGGTVTIDGYWSKTELTSQTVQKIINFDPSSAGSGTSTVPDNVLTDDDKPNILSWQIGTDNQGNPITLQDWINSKVSTSSGSGSGTGTNNVDIALEVRHAILNELGVANPSTYEGNFFNEMPQFLANKGTFTGFQTKENLVTDLNAKLYDNNGDLIGQTRLAQALSGLNKLNASLLDSNGNVKGIITTENISSYITTGEGGNEQTVADATISTWASRVWDEGKKLWTNAAGWKLSSFIKILATQPGGEETSANGLTDAQYKQIMGPEIIGTINQNGDNKLTISADKIDIAGVINIINNDNGSSLKINADHIDMSGAELVAKLGSAKIDASNIKLGSTNFGQIFSDDTIDFGSIEFYGKPVDWSELPAQLLGGGFVLEYFTNNDVNIGPGYVLIGKVDDPYEGAFNLSGIMGAQIGEFARVDAYAIFSENLYINKLSFAASGNRSIDLTLGTDYTFEHDGEKYYYLAGEEFLIYPGHIFINDMIISTDITKFNNTTINGTLEVSTGVNSATVECLNGTLTISKGIVTGWSAHNNNLTLSIS